MNPVYVVGSLNYDVSICSPEFPLPGETIFSTSFLANFGGKGGNQAVALAKLGAPVAFVGAVGNDAFGKDYLRNLKAHKIDASAVQVLNDVSTGVAVIEVNGHGENTIVIHSGANARVKSIDDTLLSQASFIMLQNEIPMETNLEVISIAKKCGIPVILDPAPASSSFPKEFFDGIAFVTPNETEAKTITGQSVTDLASAQNTAKWFFERGTKCCLFKSGKDGVYVVHSNGEAFKVPSFSELKAVDTTAAGDSFNAGFIYAVAAGNSLEMSAVFANAVAGISVTRRGAQASAPTLKEVKAFLDSKNCEKK